MYHNHDIKDPINGDQIVLCAMPQEEGKKGRTIDGNEQLVHDPTTSSGRQEGGTG
jgi:hypothetical protein